MSNSEVWKKARTLNQMTNTSLGNFSLNKFCSSQFLVLRKLKMPPSYLSFVTVAESLYYLKYYCKRDICVFKS